MSNRFNKTYMASTNVSANIAINNYIRDDNFRKKLIRNTSQLRN